MAVIAYVVVAAVMFWLGMIFAFLGGLIFIVVAAVLGGLKLAGVFPWSWWWAMVPLWVVAGGAVLKMRMALRENRLY
jgi:hypothetical protein